MNEITNIILQHNAISSLFKESEKKYIFDQLKFSIESDLSYEEQCRLGFFLVNAIFSKEQDDQREIAEKAYKLLKSIDIVFGDNIRYFSDIFGIDGIDPKALYYFYLANIALKADKLINIRIDLRAYSPNEAVDNWKFRLLNKALEAYILLVRKQDGFLDIRKAWSIIETLKKEQSQFEETYLKQFSIANEVEEAYLLLAMYHLSKAIVETASYLENGYDYTGTRIDATIRQHLDTAKKLAKNELWLVSILSFFEFGLKTICKNAIWGQTGFNDKIKQLCRKKANSEIIELLPSQRDALAKHVLDVTSNVTVLQLPTSAGKTLLAEFDIIVTKALKSDAKIVYIVPSRALVNQVYYDLKTDLESLGFIVEKTSSAIEIDPTEDSFLTGMENIDILVSTPEKLDLLVRRKHPSVENVSMFILDEAHTIQNGERGAKLELLMAILRRERPNAKYMLLSPFIKNAGQVITNWLGGGNSIAVDWKPSEKLILGVDCKISEKGQRNEVHVEVLPSPYESIEPITKTIIHNQHSIKSTGDKDRILEYSIKQFSERDKTFLVLCYGKTFANNRADFIFDTISAYEPNDDVRLIKKFIDDEVGRPTILSKVIERGIVTHHAGMSDETKLLVEYLIRNKQIQYVCATTTIAEGVNFPISTVFFDDYRKGRDDKLSANDFWNIAGRAGRTLVDNYGKIILPFNSVENKKNAKELLKNSANTLVSVLADLFENADHIEQILKDTSKDGLSELRATYSNSLSPLIQYFVHLLTVGENKHYVAEIEDLFKDSLEYYLLDTEEKRQRFIAICKSIYLLIRSKFQDKGALTFADKTGFSVPSILKVMASASQKPNIKDLNKWSKEELFNISDSANLAEKISIIANLRETKLGVDEVGPFYPDLYARIIIKWVKGEKLVNIANIHSAFNVQNVTERVAERRITDFVKKMNDIRFKASWGLSALEGIVKGNENNIRDSYIPSLVYFGVDNEKSLALRMIGIPRALSYSLKNILKDDLSQYSFKKLRDNVKNLTNSQWDDLTPPNSTLTGMEWKRISDILVT
jgi:hypothetical protein